jgi:hypothetical protein
MDEGFRNKAIGLIGRVVKARTQCIKRKRGRKVPETTVQPVRDQYRLYGTRWTNEGVARFLLQYRQNLIDMATSAKQINEVIELVEETQKSKTQ